MANEIPLDEAVEQTTNWRELADQKLAPEDTIYAFTVPMENFEQIQGSGAVGIRAYLGKSSSDEKTLLLVGVDANGNDMIHYDEGQYVYNNTFPCPSTCDNGSPLS